MPLPPRTGRWPTTEGSAQAGYFTVASRDTKGNLITTGPYLGRIVTGTGQIQVQNSPAAPAIMADAVIRMPVDCVAKQRGVVTNIRTGEAFQIIDTQTFDDAIEVVVKVISSSSS